MSERQPSGLELKIQTIIGNFRRERIAAHEQGHADIDSIPEDTELTLWESSTWMQEAARHNEIYNQSIRRDWEEGDPRLKDD